MAAISKPYYYEDEYEYVSGGGRRTPPLNAAAMSMERGGMSYVGAAREMPARPLFKPYVVPDSPKKPGRKKHSRPELPPRRFRYPYVSAKEKVATVAAVIAVGLILWVIITMNSNHAYWQNEINSINTAAASVQEDIDILKADIEKSNNITNIEKNAVGKLGMIYPTEKQIVYLGDLAEPDESSEANEKGE